MATIDQLATVDTLALADRLPIWCDANSDTRALPINVLTEYVDGLVTTGLSTKANATAIGITGTANDMGTYTGVTIADGGTAKENIQALETAVELRVKTADLASTASGKGAALVGYLAPWNGAVSRTLKAKADEVWSVADFGAVGDNNTDDKAAIQSAIDAASARYALTGSVIELVLPSSHAITGSIQMKTGVHLRGPGKIRRKDNAAPTGAKWAGIVCNAITDFSIEGVAVEMIDRTTMLASGLTGSASIGAWNTGIDVRGCSRFQIDRCALSKYDIAILHQGNSRYSITDNIITASSGKTVQQMIDGTFTQFSAYTATGGIMVAYTGTGIPAPNTDYLISGNIIDNAGLDIGIEGLEQSYDRAPGIIENNVIRGGNSGIQAYRGSFTDPGTATTFDSGLLIANNLIQYTWQQGIYIRDMVGGSVLGNRLYRTGMGGPDGTSSIVGICFRVNPFTIGNASVTAGRVSNDHPIICQGNVIVDHGTVTGTSDSFILCEIDNVMIHDNVITRTDEFATTNGTISANKVGVAILHSNGKLVERGSIRENRITGTFTNAISVADIIGKNVKNCVLDIADNQITGAYDYVIDINWYGINVDISHNNINATASLGAVRLQRAPYSTISRNTFRGTYASNVVVTGTSNLASDYPYLLSKGVLGATNRRGSALRCNGNEVWAAVSSSAAYQALNTSGFDNSFLSRCTEFNNNSLNGKPVEFAYATATAPSSGSVKSWHRGEVVKNVNVSTSGVIQKSCITAGTYGDTSVTTTGDTTSGSPIITNVASLACYGLGMYIQPTGFSTPALIIDIDTTASTITVDANASSSNVGTTLTIPAPVFGTAETGWSADTGTAKKTTNATYTAGTTLTFSATYVQAEHTALATRLASTETALQNATQTIKALKDMLADKGFI